MSIAQQIDIDLRNAMYSADPILLQTIRAIKSKFVEQIKTGKIGNSIEDPIAIQTIRGMIKQRKASMDIYIEQKREDLAKIEEAEMKIISKYIPEEIPDSELRREILILIGETGVESIKQIGTLLKATIPKLDGRATRERISIMARILLTAYEQQKKQQHDT
jgi:uncharacterized protein